MNSVAQIKQSIKRVKEPVLRERLLMVKSSYEKPLREVADNFGCTHGKVDFWKKRYQQFGLRGLKTKQRPGRPSKITDSQAIHIKQTITKKNLRQGWQTKTIRELIKREAGVTYTRRHTIRILQKWGLERIRPRPRYTYSKEHDRKEFLKKTRPTWHVLTKNGELSSKTKASSFTM